MSTEDLSSVRTALGQDAKAGRLSRRQLGVRALALGLSAAAITDSKIWFHRRPALAHQAAAPIGAIKEILPGIIIAPRVIDTTVGPVELDLTEGDGPVVLASHGGVGGVDQARLMLTWLDPSRYRLLSVSRPGYLGTPLTSGRSFAEQADLFAALLDALEVEQAAVLALSAGGPAGYLFAVRHPERVSALVAISSVSGYEDMPERPEAANPVMQALFMSTWGQKLTKLIAEKKPDWLVQELLQGTANYADEQLQAHVDAVLGSPQALAFARAFIDTTYPYDARQAGTDNDTVQIRDLDPLPLAQVRCPALIVHGTHDADVSFSDGIYAAEQIPGAEYVWLEEGSHLGFWLDPDAPRAQSTARAFLERVLAGE